MIAAWHNDPEDFDDDYPDEPDETGTVICANCDEAVYEDSPTCPYCRQYLIAKSSRFLDGKPVWYVLLALMGIFATICMLLLF